MKRGRKPARGLRPAEVLVVFAIALILAQAFYPSARRWWFGKYGRRVPAHVESVECRGRSGCWAEFLYIPDLDQPAKTGRSRVLRGGTLGGFALFIPEGEGRITGVELEDDGGYAKVRRRFMLGALGLLAVVLVKYRRVRRA